MHELKKIYFVMRGLDHAKSNEHSKEMKKMYDSLASVCCFAGKGSKSLNELWWWLLSVINLLWWSITTTSCHWHS